MKPIYTFDTKKKCSVLAGWFTYGGTFFKKVSKAKHFHRLTNSYAIQCDVLVALSGIDCKRIDIYEGKKVYQSLFSQWFAPDIREMDFGHGKQTFLPLDRMKLLTQPKLKKVENETGNAGR